MLFYTGTTLAAAMYIVGAVEIVLVRKVIKLYESIILTFVIPNIDVYGTLGFNIWRFY